MKGSVLLGLLFATYAVSAISPTVPSKDADGCYSISTVEELYGFAKQVNSGEEKKLDQITCAKLENDITINKNVMDEVEFGEEDGVPPTLKCAKDGGTCSLQKWNPIGSESTQFHGIFDGQGHTVSGLYVDAFSYPAGFFGYVSYGGGIIKNLNIADSYIKGGSHVGGISGRGGNIYNSSFSGVVVGSEVVGGIAGSADDAFRCHNDGYVWGEDEVGGIGLVMAEQCYNTGTVYSEKTGGGIRSTYGAIYQCYNTGSVKGGSVGGLVGTSFFNIVIENSFNVGQVQGWYQSGFTNIIDTADLQIRNSYSIAVNEKPDGYVEYPNYGTIVDESAFTDGTIVDLLNNDGYFVDIWEQGEKHPVLRDYAPKIKNGVYQIENEEQLVWFARVSPGDKTLKAVLLKDLVFNRNVTSDECLKNGTECKFFSWDSPVAFAGTLDGQFHSISGLYTTKDRVHIASYKSVGLFESIESTGVVKNLIIKDSYFNSDAKFRHDAALAGSNDGTISECFFENVYTGDEVTEVNKVAGFNSGTVIQTRIANKDLWFDGINYTPYKYKACQSITGSFCETSEEPRVSLGSAAVVRTPYPSFRETMDSLGYLGYKYRIKKDLAKKDMKITIHLDKGDEAIGRDSVVSKAKGFCTTYMSDHDIVIRVGFCSAVLPKTSKVSTVETSLGNFKYYNPSDTDEVKPCNYDKDIYLDIVDSVAVEGTLRLFEFGPRGTCKGDAKTVKEPEFDQCYNNNWMSCEQYEEEERTATPVLDKPLDVRMFVSGKSLHFYGTSAQAKFQIVNLKGEVVKRGLASSNVPLNGLKSGIYVVRVQDGHSSVYRMVVLKGI